MDTADIARLRLASQWLIGSTATKPEQVVSRLGAVQAQEYALSLWGLNIRMRATTEAALERAFNEGKLLRTHVMRPTWHFLAPQDIRWMLALTGGRVDALVATYYRQVGLDAATFKRTERTIVRALRDGNHLTRTELKGRMEQQGIRLTNMQMGFVMSRAELTALVCSGARQGKQHTYALLEERVPAAKPRTMDESLAELTRRYFTSHGPATTKDFMWWSGLRSGDIRRGLEMVGTSITSAEVMGKTYWMSRQLPDVSADTPDAYLLPPYDEYLISYADRTAVLDPTHRPLINTTGNGVFWSTILFGGRVIGMWRRTVKRESVVVEIGPFRTFSAEEKRAVEIAAERYGSFLKLPVTVSG